MAKQSRQSGDPIRVNLNGEVADDVATAAQKLGISYSAYVQLRLQGELRPNQTNLIQLEPSRPVSASNKPERPFMVLPRPSQIAQDGPEQLIQTVGDLPPI